MAKRPPDSEIKRVLLQAKEAASEIYRKEKKKAEAAWKKKRPYSGAGHSFVVIRMNARTGKARAIADVSDSIRGMDLVKVGAGTFHLYISECSFLGSMAALRLPRSFQKG